RDKEPKKMHVPSSCYVGSSWRVLPRTEMEKNESKGVWRDLNYAKTSSGSLSSVLNGSSHSPTALNGAPSTPNGFRDRDGLHPEHLAKRPCTVSPSQRFSPSSGLPAHPPLNGLPTHPPNGLSHPNPPAPQHYRLEDMALTHHYRDAYRHAEQRDVRDRHRQTAVHGARQEEVIDHRLTDREWAEEWKHLDNLLNCIMDMVEKTRRSLTVLRRCQEADREEMNHWIRRYSDVEDMKKGGMVSMSQHTTQMNAI
uniref:Protein CBFA2T3-like n=1 Tax=Sinocyclocheilus anshuiensis TaxID=1608454 RepID=A0A671QZF6_9TELE